MLESIDKAILNFDKFTNSKDLKAIICNFLKYYVLTNRDKDSIKITCIKEIELNILKCIERNL